MANILVFFLRKNLFNKITIACEATLVLVVATEFGWALVVVDQCRDHLWACQHLWKISNTGVAQLTVSDCVVTENT